MSDLSELQRLGQDFNGRAGGRSARAEVRNPILSLPSARRLADLDDDAREIVVSILRDIQSDSRERAEKCWRTHKAPMAAYWKAVSVYAGHIGRAVRKAR